LTILLLHSSIPEAEDGPGTARFHEPGVIGDSQPYRKALRRYLLSWYLPKICSFRLINIFRIAVNPRLLAVEIRICPKPKLASLIAL
jgi:hypothetical protein